jgi:hypothetical protein
MHIFFYTVKNGGSLDVAAFKKLFDIKIIDVERITPELGILATDATFDTLCYFGCFETLIQIPVRVIKTIHDLGV